MRSLLVITKDKNVVLSWKTLIFISSAGTFCPADINTRKLGGFVLEELICGEAC